MPEDPVRGDNGGEGRPGVALHRTARLAAAAAVTLTLGVTALFGYDDRRIDLSDAWTVLPDGRATIIDSTGSPGPRELLVLGRSTSVVRRLPPFLGHGTSVRPTRGEGGLSVSTTGRVLLRLGQLDDREGGQITEISPSDGMNETVPLIRWTEGAVVGITDHGLAVFRQDTTLFVLSATGEGTPLLDMAALGVRRDRTNLAGVALGADGHLAVLVGQADRPDGFTLFVREPGGSPAWTTKIARRTLVGDAPSGQRRLAPSVAFAADGSDVAVGGNAGVVLYRDGRVLSHITVASSARRRLLRARPGLAALPHGRWALGLHPVSVVDPSGRVHDPGSAPCPRESVVRRRCRALLAGHVLPRPERVLPPGAAAVVASTLIGLVLIGRAQRAEHLRICLGLTALIAIWVTAWLIVSLAWGDLHGSAPLFLFGGTLGAIISPAFPPQPRDATNRDPHSSGPYQPWVSPRIAGRPAAVGGARPLEVVPLPSRS